jgi:hypothetical protein
LIRKTNYERLYERPAELVSKAPCGTRDHANLSREPSLNFSVDKNESTYTLFCIENDGNVLGTEDTLLSGRHWVRRLAYAKREINGMARATSRVVMVEDN